MAGEKQVPIVKYICTKCGAEFDAQQGSRRYLCGKCLVEKVTSGKSESDHKMD